MRTTEQAARCEGEKKLLQAKLAIGSATDAFEVEANQIAERFASSPANMHVGGSPIRVSRLAPGDADRQTLAPPSVERTVATQGTPMNSPLRVDFEQKFGRNFSNVRLHTSAEAERSARDVNARAYTVGRDIVFGAGQFAPETNHGRQLLAHELTHVIQQSSPAFQSTSKANSAEMAVGRGVASPLTMKWQGPSVLQRQEAKAQGGRKLTLDELKQLDPSIQLMLWGTEFAQGFRRSGAPARLGETASAVIEAGFSGAINSPFSFKVGYTLGVPVGVGKAVVSAIEGVVQLAWGAMKLWWNSQFHPEEIKAEFQKIGEAISLAFGAAEPLGFYAGQRLAEQAAKAGLQFINGSPFDKGYAVGEVVGRIVGEVGLLFIGVGEVSAAVKALSKTRVGILMLEAMESSRILKTLIKAPGAVEETRAAAKAASEVHDVVPAIKAAEEAKPAAAGAEQAGKTEEAGKAAKALKTIDGEALPASLSKNSISEAEALAEAQFVDRHPQLVEPDGTARKSVSTKSSNCPTADVHDIQMADKLWCVRRRFLASCEKYGSTFRKFRASTLAAGNEDDACGSERGRNLENYQALRCSVGTSKNG